MDTKTDGHCVNLVYRRASGPERPLGWKAACTNNVAVSFDYAGSTSDEITLVRLETATSDQVPINYMTLFNGPAACLAAVQEEPAAPAIIC
jgi:hypothetical protein